MKYVVVGGGIAGVSCAYELLRGLKRAEDEVLLISTSEHVKTVSNWTKLGQFAEYFTVTESRLFPDDRRFTFCRAQVVGWDAERKVLQTDQGELVYDRLCIATGARPRLPFEDSKILVLRDSDSASLLQERLHGCSSVAIVGNGGIATELVYELKTVNIDWIIRDKYPSSVFFLPEVSKFLESRILRGRTEGAKSSGVLKRERFRVGQASTSTETATGCALGPDWNSSVLLQGASDAHRVQFHCSTEVVGVSSDEKLTLQLSSGRSLACDLAIWAIGVAPASELWRKSLKVGEDGAVVVNEQMRTSLKAVYACGDVCQVEWGTAPSSWKQMRLWTQARQMGLYCARCMLAAAADEPPAELDFCFELFAHVTYFCGMKVVLLGDYKAERQGDDDWYTRERIIGDREYVCCVMSRHRVVGATLVGETQLEETMENLILNGTDLSQLEEHFLDPGIDLEDYFD